MKKNIINMKKWTLKVHFDYYHSQHYYFLCGIADFHPRLGTNAIITNTSDIIDGKIENDVFIANTLNSIYYCPLKYLKVENIIIEKEDERDSVLKTLVNCELDIQNNTNTEILTEHIKELIKVGQKELIKQEKEENKQLIEQVKQFNDCLYIDLNTLYGGSKAAYHIGDKVKIVTPIVNMDTYPYMITYKTKDMIFQYSPKLFDMLIIYWSSNIKSLVIKNHKQEVLNISNKYELNPGDKIIISRDEFFKYRKENENE